MITAEKEELDGLREGDDLVTVATDATAKSGDTESKKKGKKKKKKKKKKKQQPDGASPDNSRSSTPASRRRSRNGKVDFEKKAKQDAVLWVRLANENNEIYYYHLRSGDYAWLGPCRVCYKTSQKWCNECAVPFCDEHFAESANHVSNINNNNNKTSAEINDNSKDGKIISTGQSSKSSSGLFSMPSASRLFSGSSFSSSVDHSWQAVEPYVKEELPDRLASTSLTTDKDSTAALSRGESAKSSGKSKARDKGGALRPSYCLECQLRVASKLCLECWDPYCVPCCSSIHFFYCISNH